MTQFNYLYNIDRVNRRLTLLLIEVANFSIVAET